MIDPTKIYPTPNMSPAKKSKGKQPAKTISKKKLRRKATKKWNKRAIKRLNKIRTYNVKNDVEFFNRIKRKQIVTRKQQRIINKRFKQGYSPFQKIIYNQVQVVNEGGNNQSRYIWRKACSLNFIKECFKNYPVLGNAPGTELAGASAYVKSTDQSIYFSDITFKHEILNPTNYDMTVEVYDIVMKCDTKKACESTQSTSYLGNTHNVINLMGLGTKKYGTYDATSDTGYDTIADPTDLEITDPAFKPTMSYPFNIFCTVKKKQIFRMQPASTMQHTFKWSPKALINLGYMYKYSLDTTDIGVKDITCGVLYKFTGQIAGTGTDGSNSSNPSNMKQVATLPPKLSIKEEVKVKWYCMDQKYNYIFKDGTNLWDPGNDSSKLEVGSNIILQPNKEMNIDATDNPSTSLQS